MTFTHCNFLGDLELEKKETLMHPTVSIFLMVSGFLLLRL